MSKPVHRSERDSEHDTLKSFGTVLEEIEVGVDSPALQIAHCVGEQHPTLSGRVRVEAGTQQFWAICLSSVVPRSGDRVVVARLNPEQERVVIGVIDGVRERIAAPPRTHHVHRLREDEGIVVEGADGRPMFEVRVENRRTVLRLASADVRIESAGHLELSGESIGLRAKRGPIDLESSEDVRLVGETIRLN